jgi:hypothetical protein
LLAVIASIVGTAVILGIMSIEADMRATTYMADERATMTEPARPVDAGAFLVAEIVQDGDEMLLFPQTGDVIRCNDGEVRAADGPYVFEDGRLYTWVDGRKHRVWLYGVVARNRPNVRVDG